jgi:sulfur-carrier protein
VRRRAALQSRRLATALRRVFDWEKITPMTTISLHYWAGARAAAGTELESFSAETIAQALDAAQRDRGAHFARVLDLCSVLVDGVVLRGSDLERPLQGSVVVEILPPFAGG